MSSPKEVHLKSTSYGKECHSIFTTPAALTDDIMNMFNQIRSISEAGRTMLEALRPEYIGMAASLGDMWYTAAAKHLLQTSGKFYHEVKLCSVFDRPRIGLDNIGEMCLDNIDLGNVLG
jgi:hypothetical protein